MQTIHFSCPGTQEVTAKPVSQALTIGALYMVISTIAGLTFYFEGYNRVLKHHYPSIYEFVHEHGAKKCRVAFGPETGDFVVFNAETGHAKWKHTGLSESRVLKGKKTSETLLPRAE